MAKVLLFGKLADVAGWRSRTVEAGSIAELTALLSADASLAEALAGKGVQVAVDQVLVRGDAVIGPSSEVAYLPPMSGG